MQLCDLPAHELVEIIRHRQVSAVEVLDACLERIAAVDGVPGRLEPSESQADRVPP